MSLWVDTDQDGTYDAYTETVVRRIGGVDPVPETDGEPVADETTPEDPGAPAVQGGGPALSLFQLGGGGEGDGEAPAIPWTAILLGVGGVALLLTFGGRD